MCGDQSKTAKGPECMHVDSHNKCIHWVWGQSHEGLPRIVRIAWGMSVPINEITNDRIEKKHINCRTDIIKHKHPLYVVYEWAYKSKYNSPLN